MAFFDPTNNITYDIVKYRYLCIQSRASIDISISKTIFSRELCSVLGSEKCSRIFEER